MKHRPRHVAPGHRWLVWAIALALLMQPMGAALHAAQMEARADIASATSQQNKMQMAASHSTPENAADPSTKDHRHPMGGHPCCPDFACNCAAQCLVGCGAATHPIHLLTGLVAQMRAQFRRGPDTASGPPDFLVGNRRARPPPRPANI